MPTYEYECLKCGKRFEVFHSITAPALDKCKYCKGKVKRLIGPGGGIIFKGSGFYATDYRKTKAGDKGEKKKETPPSCPAKGSSCSCCPMND